MKLLFKLSNRTSLSGGPSSLDRSMGFKNARCKGRGFEPPQNAHFLMSKTLGKKFFRGRVIFLKCSKTGDLMFARMDSLVIHGITGSVFEAKKREKPLIMCTCPVYLKKPFKVCSHPPFSAQSFGNKKLKKVKENIAWISCVHVREYYAALSPKNGRRAARKCPIFPLHFYESEMNILPQKIWAESRATWLLPGHYVECEKGTALAINVILRSHFAPFPSRKNLQM